MKDFDPFDEQKQQSFTDSLQQIASIGTFLSGLIKSEEVTSRSSEQIKIEFEHLVLVSWVLLERTEYCMSRIFNGRQIVSSIGLQKKCGIIRTPNAYYMGVSTMESH